MGHVSVTESGLTCQAWRAQVPHSHYDGNPEYFKNETLRDAANYCRRPTKPEDDGRTRPWCYTTHPDMRWEYCDIPLCNPPTTNLPTPAPQDKELGRFVIKTLFLGYR